MLMLMNSYKNAHHPIRSEVISETAKIFELIELII